MKLFLVGGFLGSGKTTAIQKASSELLERNVRVGVVTNDQGDQLVDGKFIQASRVPAMEVTNGCFCCKYEELTKVLQSFQENNKSEMILAESVGSCTDLLATVVKPLSKFHPEIESIISIFVDVRVLPDFLRDSSLFANAVSYIYKKQLEEADILVLNKADLLEVDELKVIKELIFQRFPDKVILFQNSLDKEDVKRWLNVLDNTRSQEYKQSLDLNYDIYGAGEAELAWYDADIELLTDGLTNLTEVGNALINRIYEQIMEQHLPIGHLKFFVDDGVEQKKVSFTSDSLPRLYSDLKNYKIKKLKILINARVQTTHMQLRNLIFEVINDIKLQYKCEIIEKKVSAFQPGFPRPLHRIN